MTSEEQYLDDLLKSMMSNEPKQRTLSDALSDVGVVIPEENKAVSETIEPESFDLPSENVIDEVPAEDTVISQETLADMLDILEDPTAFSSEVLPQDVAIPESQSDEIALDQEISLLEEPVFEEPVIEEPVIDELIMDEPVVEEPLIEEPVIEESEIEEPVIEEPVIEEPVIDEPVMDELIMDEPIQDEPVIEEPAIEEPVFEDEPMEDSDSTGESEDELLEMLKNAQTAEDFVMPESRMTEEETPVEALFDENEEITETSFSEDMPIDDMPIDDMPIEDIPDEGMSIDELPSEEINLEELMSAESEDSVQDETSDSDDIDLDALLQQAMGDNPPIEQENQNAEISDGETAETESEMSDLEKLEATGDSDDDLLALLEGIDETATDDEASDEFETDSDAPIMDENAEEPAKEKKSFLSFLPFFKKNKKKKSDENEVNDEEAAASDGVIHASEEEMDALLLDALDEKEDKAEKSVPEKKPSLFARIMAFLMEEDEEEEEKPAEEVTNDDILDAIDAENAENMAELEAIPEKGKKGKKDKKKDKKNKKDKKGDGDSDAEGDGEEGDGSSDKKKKKPKKEKAPKEPKEKEPRKVVLSKKANIALCAFCITLVAAVVILSSILPDYNEKATARRAYYEGDFEAVYENLYDKALNESDAILFSRAKTVMAMQRRWDSYINRTRLKQDAEALDSLIEGVYLYGEISPNCDEEIRLKVDEIYTTITNELNSKYNITPEQALAIYNIPDDKEYTSVIYSLINGGGYNNASHIIEAAPEESINAPEETSDDFTDDVIDENAVDVTEDSLTDTLGENDDPANDVSDESDVIFTDIIPGEEDL